MGWVWLAPDPRDKERDLRPRKGRWGVETGVSRDANSRIKSSKGKYSDIRVGNYRKEESWMEDWSRARRWGGRTQECFGERWAEKRNGCLVK